MNPLHEPTDDAARERVDEDDHDLLTFGEAGERLRIEIAAAAAEVEKIGRDGSDAQREAATARLQALRAAAERNSAQPINDANFEKFFGYPGKARRNLGDPPPAR
jgi:hypothetical protein